MPSKITIRSGESCLVTADMSEALADFSAVASRLSQYIQLMVHSNEKEQGRVAHYHRLLSSSSNLRL